MQESTQSYANDAHDLDTVYSLLGDEHCRDAVKYLSGQEPPVTLDELATAGATLETNADADGDTAERIAANLHHIHLPKLSDSDFITYDTEGNTVTSIQMEVVIPFLELPENGR